jgi:hypothetical protein
MAIRYCWVVVSGVHAKLPDLGVVHQKVIDLFELLYLLFVSDFFVVQNELVGVLDLALVKILLLPHLSPMWQVSSGLASGYN